MSLVTFGTVMRKFLEQILAAIALLILSPFLILLAILIRAESRGNPIFIQSRVGMNLKAFKLYKFRTMFHQKPNSCHFTLEGDERVTPIGRIIRRFKLDELLQLYNVMKGDMSFVGPRPQMPSVAALYDPQKLKDIYSVKPGITGLDSLVFSHEGQSLASAADPEKYYQKCVRQKERICLRYVRKKSLMLDLGIVLHTLKKVFR